MKILRKLLRTFILFLSLYASINLLYTPSSLSAPQCSNLFQTTSNELANKFSSEGARRILKERNLPLPQRNKSLLLLAKFAAKHNLPYRWHDFGPSDRKIRRLVVAVDINNEPLMKEYRDLFNLTQKLSPGIKKGGTLVIEQTWENPAQPEHYVYTYIRTSPKPEDPIYRWQQKEQPWNSSFNNLKRFVNSDTGLIGLAHLIELAPREKINVETFLENPELRAKCKSDNCVAWITGTELGITKKDATDAERQYLFNELGISRTIAPFEISRRLLHASNERHVALVAFVNGEKGIKSFKENFNENLVPEPKIPYSSILKNYVAKNPATPAISKINDGDKVFVPIAAGASPEAIEALIERSTQLNKGVDVHVLVNGISANTLRKGIETTDKKFRVHALFLGGNLRELYKEKKVTVIPGNLSDFGRMIADPTKTEFHYNTILVRVSPPNSKGYHSLGPNHDMVMTILRDRPNIKIIAEINPNVPFTHGSNKIHQSKITASFESTTELAGPTSVPPNEIDAKIGKNLGSLITSNSVLQVGIGNIFGGLPEGLKSYGRQNIKISTEMFGDHMMEMMKLGIATSAETGFAFGTGNLYKWLDKNQQVNFVSTEYVNSPGRVAKTPNFHAVNTALQVDLYGQVNATMGPEGRISSPGGQVEFMSGAARSIGGKAIIAIRSTAKNETLSTITSRLYDGPITTPHESVTHVVTEYGVANLQGKTSDIRAIELINVAHPKFRKTLADDAVRSGLIHADQINKIKLEPIE